MYTDDTPVTRADIEALEEKLHSLRTELLVALNAKDTMQAALKLESVDATQVESDQSVSRSTLNERLKKFTGGAPARGGIPRQQRFK